jgi:hypothetical protein
MVESAACMPQNSRLELIQSLFLVNDGKSAAFMLQNSNGAMDGHRTMDRLSYPDLLHSQMWYIMYTNVTNLMVESAACMPQNLITNLLLIHVYIYKCNKSNGRIFGMHVT